jgi:dihydrofolate reductase
MPHPTSPAPGSARYVTDPIESCVAQAKAAAGGRDILLHGAATAQACLQAGLLDELQLQLIPVLIGQGRRLLEDLPPDHVELELLRGPGRAWRAAPALPRTDEGLRRWG